MNMKLLLGELMHVAASVAGELAADELLQMHGAKLRAVRAIAQLRKTDPHVLRVLAARIEASGADPGEHARASSAAAELVQALADWNDEPRSG
jgi:hypothetical protein